MFTSTTSRHLVVSAAFAGAFLALGFSVLVDCFADAKEHDSAVSELVNEATDETE
jgi:formate/nitrite transporter FocA (FNT family)